MMRPKSWLLMSWALGDDEVRFVEHIERTYLGLERVAVAEDKSFCKREIEDLVRRAVDDLPLQRVGFSRRFVEEHLTGECGRSESVRAATLSTNCGADRSVGISSEHFRREEEASIKVRDKVPRRACNWACVGRIYQHNRTRWTRWSIRHKSD